MNAIIITAEKILEKAIEEESEVDKREKLASYLQDIILCKNAGTRRHLEVLFPDILKKLKKEFGISID